jgi:DNA processing protein
MGEAAGPGSSAGAGPSAERKPAAPLLSQRQDGTSAPPVDAAAAGAAAAPETARPFDASSDAFWACHRLAAALLPPHRVRALLTAFPSPVEVMDAPPARLRGADIGLTEKQAARLAEAAAAPVPLALRERAERLGVLAVTFRDHPGVYPANLCPLSDAPPLLFVRGALLADDRFSVAIVGSRRATAYGCGQADRFARAFAARGLVVVSGGAAGIDTAAHRGALSAGGRTIAVLGCGVDVVYPAENRGLFAEIAQPAGPLGALISEFPLGTLPEPWRFPARNRIIAGIARAVVVVETPRDSGALITARNAAEYGREVWAVPGPVDSGRSRGGHQLIQDGASLADAPEDVLVGLGISIDEVPWASLPAAEALRRRPRLQPRRLRLPIYRPTRRRCSPTSI